MTTENEESDASETDDEATNWAVSPAMPINLLKKIGMSFWVSLKQNNFKS